jgi:hypothetical protein
VTGEAPVLSATDPSYRMEQAGADAPADVVLDLGDGAAYRAASGSALWGAAEESRVVLGVEPRSTKAAAVGPARAVLETLAAGEALRLLLGHEAHAYDFALVSTHSPGRS